MRNEQELEAEAAAHAVDVHCVVLELAATEKEAGKKHATYYYLTWTTTTTN